MSVPGILSLWPIPKFEEDFERTSKSKGKPTNPARIVQSSALSLHVGRALDHILAAIRAIDRTINDAPSPSNTGAPFVLSMPGRKRLGLKPGREDMLKKDMGLLPKPPGIASITGRIVFMGRGGGPASGISVIVSMVLIFQLFLVLFLSFFLFRFLEGSCNCGICIMVERKVYETRRG